MEIDIKQHTAEKEKLEKLKIDIEAEHQELCNAQIIRISDEQSQDFALYMNSLVSLSSSVMKSLLLLNGSAAVALFYNLYTASDKSGLTSALLLCVVGAVLAVLAQGTAYFCQFRLNAISQYNYSKIKDFWRQVGMRNKKAQEEILDSMKENSEKFWFWSTIISCLGSLILFICSIVALYNNFQINAS